MVYALPKHGLKLLVLYSLVSEAWKVTDFGFTMEGSSRRAHVTSYSRGTSSYRAPELICEGQAKYTNKVDLWGVGCILYELVLGRKAFGNDFEILRYANSGKGYNFVIEPEIVPDDRRRRFISKIIKELLSIDPTQRPRANVLYERFISWGSDISTNQRDPTVVENTTKAFDITMLTSVIEFPTRHFAHPNLLFGFGSFPSCNHLAIVLFDTPKS